RPWSRDALDHRGRQTSPMHRHSLMARLVCHSGRKYKRWRDWIWANLGFDRESDREHRPFADSTCDGDRAFVQLDDSLHARQANACARDATLHVSSAVKALEDMRQVVLRYALTAIRHAQDGRVTFPAD